jgi:serpin B
MNRHLRLLRPAIGAVLICSSVGCTSKTDPPPAVCGAPQGSSSAAKSLATDDTAFALAFFPPAVAAAGSSENVVLSPYSVSATMTMVDVGAAGQTESQIENVLHLPGNGTAVAPAYAALACGMENDASSNGNELLIANSLWAQQGFPFKQSFESVLENGYSAPLQQVDFETNAASAVGSINGWVSGKTQGEIPTLLQPSDVDTTTRLVLVNAVYFKGAWASAFEASRTAPQPFTLLDGSQVPVTTMSGTINLRYSSTPTMEIAELAYKGGALAMDVLLPSGMAGALPAFEATLTPAVLSGALTSLGSVQSVQLYLPRFSFKTRLALVPVLAGMGMTDVFLRKGANLSGMDARMDLYVSTVVQQALVEVDEQGTVAAAATAATVVAAQCGGCGGVPLVLRIDQPFLFLIRDTQSGGILFMGHVTDPRR